MSLRLRYFLLGLFMAQALTFAFQKQPVEQGKPGLEGLALAQFYRGEFEQAGLQYKELAASNPELIDVYAAYLFERQEYKAVEALLQSALHSEKEALRPASPRWYWLGRAQANQGRWKQAAESLSRWKDLELDPEAMRLAAEAAQQSGNTVNAAKAWDSAVALVGRGRGSALTHYKAGMFYKAQGLTETAVRLFKRAEELDGNYTQVHEPLAEIYEKAGRIAAAKTRLERAVGFDRRHQALRNQILRLEKQYPTLKTLAKKEQAAKAKRRFESPNVRVEPLKAPEGTPLVRVGLITRAPSFKFRTGGPVRVFHVGGDEPKDAGLELPGGTVFDVSLRGRRWRLLQVSPKGDKHSKVLLRFRKPVLLQPQHPESTLRLFDIAYGAGYYWASSEDRFYRGSIEIMPRGSKGVTVINIVNMEEYLQGVVPSEIPPHWPAEALRAQAIAARTHAWADRGRFRKEGFDICPTQACAVYRGVTAEHPNTNAAVQATMGKVLEDPATGKLLPVFYMSNSGGHTQDPGDAWKWSPDVPSSSVFDGPKENPFADEFPLRPDHLLRWLEDRGPWPVESYSRRPAKERPSNFRWIMQYDAARLERYVKRRHPKIGSLLKVEPLDRSKAGYVKQVLFTGTKGSSIGSSDYIRSAIKGLKSTMFYVETRRNADGDPVEFLFHGGGWGHGVGLCQTGAAGMAELNFKGEEILAHYFPGGLLRKRY